MEAWEFAKQLFITSPLAGVLFLIWWLQRKDRKDEQREHRKAQKRWEFFLMTHIVGKEAAEILEEELEEVEAEDDEEE